MRKLLLAAVAAAVLVPGAGQAQSAHEVHQDLREVRRDVARGDYKEAREDRKEAQEDWRDYRKSHRHVYHRPAYVAPRGLHYHPVYVGVQINPAFYGRTYWVTDYATYRLAPPAPGLTYIRYGNDVLLVNVRTGRVVQVHSAFFW